MSNKIEDGLEERLPSIIGPAESYEVEVSGRALKMIDGRLAKILIHGRNVKLQGFPVDDLEVEMRGVVFDKEKSQLESAEQTLFTAIVGEKTLVNYIRRNQPDIKDLRLKLANGAMTVQTRPRALGLSAPVSLTGKLRLRPGNKVDMDTDTMSVAGLNVPGRVIDFIMNRVNPVLDLSLGNFPAVITKVTIQPGAIKVEGTADLTHGMQVAAAK